MAYSGGKLIELEMVEGGYLLDTGYQYVDIAVDAGEIASLLPAGNDKDGTPVTEIFVKGMQMFRVKKDGEDTVAAKVPGRLFKGYWKDLLQKVNDARP